MRIIAIIYSTFTFRSDTVYKTAGWTGRAGILGSSGVFGPHLHHWFDSEGNFMFPERRYEETIFAIVVIYNGIW